MERDRSQILYASIDRILSKLNARFTENSDILACLNSFNPQSDDFLSALCRPNKNTFAASPNPDKKISNYDPRQDNSIYITYTNI